MRMAGALFLGAVLMAIYIMFIRANGVEGTWAFFNLLVIIHACVFLTNFYSIKIDKTGVNEKTSNEGIIAPIVFFVLSSVLVYGLSDKIYLSHFRKFQFFQK